MEQPVTGHLKSLPILTDGARELRCMEMMGGNRTINESLNSPGLDVWIRSQPFESAAGGDVYYFSVCGSGRVTRLAIGDVSGHGMAVDHVANQLRRMMRKYINLLDQTHFAYELNREFIRKDEAEHFATILLLTYFAPTDHLIVCNGGHPAPLWYSTRLKKWQPLHTGLADTGKSIRESRERYRLRRVSNLPLGVIEPTEYHQFAIHLQPGDLVLLYSDAFIEAQNTRGDFLENEGLLEMVRDLDMTAPQEMVNELFARLDAWRGDVQRADDETAILLHHNATNPPRPSWGQAADVLAKLVGLRRIETSPA